ncbi:unnamed protein product [Dovyalis caffra]|uniref:Bifunctional inhibitor/plant lipid transfer protein/seed storage helical domain-containing protein n=1 Tax=Dovyalis caffra TaxID=77055 RepID=A0AAV1S269_9ROSI|nr:unnamed protein product [Dovyalis caffra]
MDAPLKFICLLGLLVLVSVAGQTDAAGECGKASPDDEAMKLAPCAAAAQDEKAAVSASCCLQVKRIGQNPSCLCAVMLSDTAKASGIKLEIAITIPKRCNLANRPVGYKCGEKVKGQTWEVGGELRAQTRKLQSINKAMKVHNNAAQTNISRKHVIFRTISNSIQIRPQLTR